MTTQTYEADAGLERQRERASLPELISQLGRQTVTLFRKETQLARTEMEEKFAHAKRSAMAFVASAVVMFAGLLFVLWAAAFGIAEFIPMWASSLIVGGSVLVIGVVMALLGRQQAHEAAPVLPEQTVDELKKDAQMLRGQL
jgi:sterol desaturase/sphingolipid hydroxylase (fatty acid hydroxylase superfamily)